MPVIRRQTVYRGIQKLKQIIHPQTEAAAIVDLPEALDAYKEQFIDPDIREKIRLIELTPGPPGIDGASFTVLSRYATLSDLSTVHPVGKAGDAYFIGPEIQPGEDRANPVYMWDADREEWFNIGTIQGPRGFVGDIGERFDTTFTYAGVQTNLSRIGNTVMWSFSGNAGAVTGTPTLPAGYRPMLPVTFYSNQSQGSTPKIVNISTNGAITVSGGTISGAAAFFSMWATAEPYPS